MITTVNVVKKFCVLSVALHAPLLFASSIDAEKSRLAITFTQMSVPVEASFKRFSADIDYDPNAVDTMRATITVDISSFDLGDAEYNKEVLKPEWFNAEKFTDARFSSESVRAIAANKLEASGTLTIKGIAQRVTVPISVKAADKGWSFSGELPINRTTFNVGEGEWKATDMVADEVMIRFTFVTENIATKTNATKP